MTRDELCALALAESHLTVETITGRVWRWRGPRGRRLAQPIEVEGCVNDGYLVMTLRVGEIRRQVYLHRLVWMAEHGQPEPDLVIDHRNGDRSDNRVANLQLLTAPDHGRIGHRRGQVCYLRKLAAGDYARIRADRVEGLTRKQLAEKYGVGVDRIKQIVRPAPRVA